MVIQSFKHRGLKRLYEKDDRSGIRPDLLDTVDRILALLDSADSTQAFDLPRYRLHGLKGDLSGYWSSRWPARRGTKSMSGGRVWAKYG